MYAPRQIPLIGLTALTLLGAACAADSTAPSAPPGRTLSISEFEQELGTGRTRIEIKLAPGVLAAREVEVEGDDDEEQIAGEATAVAAANGSGSVTLALGGGLAVGFDAQTRFRTPTDSRVTQDEWLAALEAALAGGSATVEARRNAPSDPQAPGDASFTATDLRLTDTREEARIEMYVDSDNFEANPAPPPRGWLTVLGLRIEIHGDTRLGNQRPEDGGVSEFESAVSAVDGAAGTITLASGTILRVGSSTTFDPTGDLFTLETTAAAVTAGRPVRAQGRGTVESAGPPAIVAARAVKVEVDD